MKSKTTFLFGGCSTLTLLLLPGLGYAQEGSGGIELEDISASDVAAESSTAEPSGESSEAIRAVVRGLYLEGRVGGGAMVINADLPDAAMETAPVGINSSERLGLGTKIDLAVGYDVGEFLAVQATVGATLVATRRNQPPVRDLSLFYAGVGPRVALGLSSRFNLLLSVGVAYLSATNSVEPAQKGAAALGGIGFEYYAHVRHFSLGAELSVLAPFSPFRLFVGVTPYVKYTF